MHVYVYVYVHVYMYVHAYVYMYVYVYVYMHMHRVEEGVCLGDARCDTAKGEEQQGVQSNQVDDEDVPASG